jgi:Uma2 family endonuclease
MSAITVPRLLTAEEFGAEEYESRCELVRGVCVPLLWPMPRHGQVCATVSYLLASYLEENRSGRVVGYSGIITDRNPDTVRGADLSFYSFERVPPGPLPWRYLDVVPEFVIEVHCWPDGWTQIHQKVGDFLASGVDSVVVLDDQNEQAWRFRHDDAKLFPRHADLELPPPLAGWRVPVRRFFE